jgi:uncharacterized protein
MIAPPPATTPIPLRTEVQPGIWLDARLALWLAPERLLVVADIHWGYAASHRARGNLLPCWGDDEIEQRLRALIADYYPAEMIWLGDVVHAAEGGARAERFLRQSPIPIVSIAGNHDRRWRGSGASSVRRGNYFFHHGDGSPEVPEHCVEFMGHHHPAMSWRDGAGSRLKLPVLVVGAQRMVLPAFSPWAAGTAWSSSPGASETIWAISPSRIFSVNRPAAVPHSFAT